MGATTDKIDALFDAVKRRKRGSPELQRQAAVVAALKLALPAGSVVYRITNEQRAKPGATPEQRMRFHASRKRAGLCPGFPDLGACVPGGRLLLFEVKDAKGAPDARQAELHAHLRAIGFPTFVVRDAAEAVDALRSIGITPRTSAIS
jgi:hypothetical protein